MTIRRTADLAAIPRPERARRALRAAALSGGAFALSVAVVLVASHADATSTERFVLDTAEALAAGELTGTAVHSDGRVTLGAELQRIALPDDVPLVYSVARAADGAVYLGTGNDGKIYRLRGDAVTLFAETGQLVVTSLVVGDGGNLYAGTLPEGRIYRIGADGTPSEIARPDEVQHVWALAWDAQRNVLFAGTGPEGRVYGIDRQGRAEVWWDSAASHVMSLALAADGALYAGTSDDAVVARIPAPGHAETVYDFPGNEITTLDIEGGVLAVGANEFAEPPALASTHAKQRSESSGRAPRPRPGKGRIFRIDRGGHAERLFAQDDGHITSVDLLADGTIYAGTGNDGRVIRVNPDRTYSTFIDVEERQVLRVAMEGAAPLFVTGDGAAVYRVTTGRPQNASWQSKVLDARFPSRWGQLSWGGEGQLVLQTRSGNTARPDETWSAWSADLTSAAPVRSPRARFLQVRARFERDPGATLRSVTVYFLPQNQRALVSAVRVEGPNKAATEKMRAERRDYLPEASSTYKLAWTVDNPDDDRLRYRLRFREAGQTLWRDILRDGQVLTEGEYTWNTESIPDGHYVVQVEASDELDNPSTLRLLDTRASEPLRVDNHAPSVEQLRFAAGRLSGRAVDALGPIARLEVAVDGGDWAAVFPVDDLFDTATERFDIDLSALPAGDHLVSVRATDASGNVGSGDAQVRAAP